MYGVHNNNVQISQSIKVYLHYNFCLQSFRCERLDDTAGHHTETLPRVLRAEGEGSESRSTPPIQCGGCPWQWYRIIPGTLTLNLSKVRIFKWLKFLLYCICCCAIFLITYLSKVVYLKNSRWYKKIVLGFR